ncbi:MAG: nitroreductase family protein [Acidobacteria bacterium]|nr:nitroreductase family protein [Acidobacteriota bacterium]
MTDAGSPLLDLSLDELLTTTRTVRKRLDFSRPVPREAIEECLRIAQQAPTASNKQDWHFVVVTDPDKRATVADFYRRGFGYYRTAPAAQPELSAKRQVIQDRVRSSADYLAEHMHEAPVLVIPCIARRTDGLPATAQAGTWGTIAPATWSFMLAARARGLGTAWTTLHLRYEREVAEALGIPYDEVMQIALTPVAYTLGTDFKVAPREPLETMVHWESW